jgi:hypothetical protein
MKVSSHQDLLCAHLDRSRLPRHHSDTDVRSSVSRCSLSAAAGKRVFPIAMGAWASGSGCRATASLAVAQHWIGHPGDEAADPRERQAACFWRKLL